MHTRFYETQDKDCAKRVFHIRTYIQYSNFNRLYLNLCAVCEKQHFNKEHEKCTHTYTYILYVHSYAVTLP